jgi:hypothetical protein
VKNLIPLIFLLTACAGKNGTNGTNAAAAPLTVVNTIQCSANVTYNDAMHSAPLQLDVNYQVYNYSDGSSSSLCYFDATYFIAQASAANSVCGSTYNENDINWPVTVQPEFSNPNEATLSITTPAMSQVSPVPQTFSMTCTEY